MDSTNMVRGYSTESANLMRAELRKAIQLNPTFPESYSLLAFVNTVTGAELEASIALLQKALTLSPGKQILSFHLAQIYMRQQKFDLARQTLEPLRTASDRQLQKQAEMLLESIKRYQDQVTQSNATRDSNAGDRPELRRFEAKESTTEEPPKTESDYLREALRPVGAGEQQIQGMFMKLDCDNKGVAYFTVQASNRAYRIRATALQQVQLTAYAPAPAEVSCGVRKNPENIVLTFRPSNEPKDARAKIDGDAIAVEVVPKDFKLKN
jgi:tetratricopeptide (TPR) repeat protein